MRVHLADLAEHGVRIEKQEVEESHHNHWMSEGENPLGPVEYHNQAIALFCSFFATSLSTPLSHASLFGHTTY